MIKPQLGETIADFACGTGGFLTSSLNYLKNQRSSTDDVRKYNESVFGIEKKSVPYLLCMTNMLIHDVDDPKIYHDNSLEKNIRDYTPSDKFDIILMNPPYGGTEKPEVQQNFPVDYRSSETADLFVDVIMARLKGNGRCGVVLPDGFLFTNTGVKSKIKEKLFKEFNVHTIIRLPHDVFAPYTNITTNILFFDKSGPTKETWFYRLDMPEGYKHFSKTKPILIDHFEPAVEWWNDRKPLQDEDGNPKAKCFSSTELEKTGYDLDLCGFPHEEEEVLEPLDLISKYQTEKNELDENIRNVLQQIEDLINKK
jgi:type I restriction enzyme M protein